MSSNFTGEEGDQDWDRPFTDQELAAIDAAFLAATSSATATAKRHQPIDDSDGLSDKKSRRRLPDSLFTCHQNNSNSVPRSSSYRGNVAMQYPEITFRGQVVYSRSSDEVEKSAAELLKFVQVQKRNGGQAILGFDIEWRPTFRRGVAPGKCAVMQICGDKSICYVMHVHHSGIPPKLQCLLEDPTSLKVGVCIANDARKVFFDHNVSVKDLEDLSDLANQKLEGEVKSWSLSSLTETLICKQLPKPKNIRLGNWEANILSKEQLSYAATDAYVSWYLYQVLQILPKVEVIKTNQEPQGTSGNIATQSLT